MAVATYGVARCTEYFMYYSIIITDFAVVYLNRMNESVKYFAKSYPKNISCSIRSYLCNITVLICCCIVMYFPVISTNACVSSVDWLTAVSFGRFRKQENSILILFRGSIPIKSPPQIVVAKIILIKVVITAVCSKVVKQFDNGVENGSPTV